MVSLSDGVATDLKTVNRIKSTCSVTVTLTPPAAPSNLNYFVGNPADSSTIIPAYTVTAVD